MAKTKANSKKSPLISPKPRKQPLKASDDFASVAKRLECDPDMAAFDKKLGKIAKAKPTSASKK